MKPEYPDHPPRRLPALVSLDGVTFLRWQDPKIIVWWAIAFPGFGHFLLHQFIRGFLLTTWEVGINSIAHINEAIVYSFSGRYQMAIDVLEQRWVIAYAVVYLFSIWDSYIKAVDANKQYHLAKMEGAKIRSNIMNAWTISNIGFKRPAAALMCSFFFPGLGQLYNNRVALGFYGVIWWVIHMTMSRSHEAIILLILGRTSEANAILNPQWLLFMPSVLGGAMYDAFMTARGHNQLFRLEQKQYFTERYPHFPLHLFGEEMSPNADH